MTTGSLPTLRTLPLLLAVFLVCAPAVARFGGGTGEPNDPWLIYTPEQMDAMGNFPTDWHRHFKLMADIDMSGYPADRQHGISQFSGVFDGNGHVISHFTRTDGSLFGYMRRVPGGPDPVIKNLTMIDPNVQAAAGCLVGYLREGSISNCHVMGGCVSGRQNVGGLVGEVRSEGVIVGCHSTATVSGSNRVGGLVGCNGGSISNCYAAAAVSCQDYTAGGLVGLNGISLATGNVMRGTITCCYSSGTVSGQRYIGGLVGRDEGSLVIDSYSTAGVTGDRYVGGLVAGLNLSNILRCYATGEVTGVSNTGGLIPTGYAGNTRTRGGLISESPGYYHRSAVIASFWDVQTSGQSASAGGIGLTTTELRDPRAFLAAEWHFVGLPGGPSGIWAEPSGGGTPILWWQLPQTPTLPAFSGGTGDACDPYLIVTASDLNSIGYNPRLMESHFRLIANTNLADMEFHSIGDAAYPFAGAFDGGGFHISNLSVASAGTFSTGLFACIDGKASQVRDLVLVDSHIEAEGGRNVGALVGQLKSGALINCHAQDVWVRGGANVGGLVGYSAGTITACHAVGAVTGDEAVGGLVGMIDRTGPDNQGAISYCYSAGSVSGGGAWIGGLVGISIGRMTCSYSRCDVAGDTCVGGLAGRIFPNRLPAIAECYSAGRVHGKSYVGGLVGYNSAEAVRSFWDMQTSGQTEGIAGVGMQTAAMQMARTFLDAGWDFVGETANGTEDLWWILEGRSYPHLWWEAAEE